MSTRLPTVSHRTPQPMSANDDNRLRDAWEFELLSGAIRRGIPVLGICRGAQVVNVALGGTLHQHLPEVRRPF